MLYEVILLVLKLFQKEFVINIIPFANSDDFHNNIILIIAVLYVCVKCC